MSGGKVGAALVVGGGIGGMQAALDLAASGIKVFVVEKKAGIGGVMAQLDKTFPTNDCAMCTMAPRLADISRARDIELLTLSDVEKVEGEAGRFRVTVRRRPRYVDESACTGCGSCASACPVRYRTQPIPPERRTPLELAPDLRREVGAIVERWRGHEGPLMPILQEVNARYRWFPDGVLAFIAGEMGLPLSHLYRIATFYSAFSITPRGRWVVNVCMGTTCYVRGAERLMERFGTVLGVGVDGTTPDGLFTLKSVRCIGCCGLAPAVSVAGEVHGKLSVGAVAGIVDARRKTEAA